MLLSLAENFGNTDFILASASPRRSELLSQIGLKFKIIASKFKEEKISADDKEKGLIHNALNKGMHVADIYPDALVISADTIVVMENRIMGKPKSREEAQDMLTELSGKTHLVMTAFSLIISRMNKTYSECVSTRVHFRSLNAEEITTYINTGEPFDKAGAYAIQGMGALLIDSIDGCYFNVVGFPLSRFYIALRSFSKQQN